MCAAGPTRATDDRRRGAARRLPAGFRFGISDSGHQCEGGYNGLGQPANNWAAWERSGRAAPAGAANQFWDRYPEYFERSRAIGLDAYRLSVEWTRCEPREGRVDRDALDHYARILRSCRAHGLEPVVALHHFTHPAWLGADFWLDERAPRRFAAWVELAVERLAPHCSRWMTINEINALAIGSYLIGYFPPGRRLHRRDMARAMDHLLAAHVLAYDAIHRVQPEATVGTSTYSFWSYDADRVLIDVLGSRAHGVEHHDVVSWLEGRRRRYHDEVLAGLTPAAALPDRAVHAALARYLRTPRALPTAIRAVHESPHERCLDVNQINYYAPQLSKYLCRPGRHAAGARRWGPDPKHWEQVPAPEHFAAYLRAHHEPGQPIWVLENGMCNPVVAGRAYPRPDGLDRATYFRRHLEAILDAVDQGVDVQAYFPWALYDNYQWGDYESCFGLCAVRRDGEDVTYLDHDALGHDSAGALARLIAELRPREAVIDLDAATSNPVETPRHAAVPV